MIKKIVIFTITLIIIGIAYNRYSKNKLIDSQQMNLIKNIPQAKWDKLSSKKIYFGHQSVGFNIIDGIKINLKENPNIRLNIAQGHTPPLFFEPVFAHDGNGKNGDPISKIDAFYDAIENGLGKSANIAGFKFCYADFKKGSDVNSVFHYYKFRMKELQMKYPELKIIHFTVPLRSNQLGPKGFINKMLGREIGITDNQIRQKFNTLLLTEFDEKSIFDLARFESTYFDGKRCFDVVDGQKIYSMVRAYTNDGGHLSKKGKYWISANLLMFLTD